MKYALAAIVVFVVVTVLMPLACRLAGRIGFVDRPTERKNHQSPIPLIGGAVMCAGIFIGAALFAPPDNRREWSVLVAALLILIIGLVDDAYKTRGLEFSVWPRLAVQIGAAVLVYRSGIVFRGFTNPFDHQYVQLPQALQFMLTITWLLGLTTVINWSDGMDGLAGTLSAIAASTMFVVAMYMKQSDSAMLSALLVGAAIGFLRFNRHPATVFMGDSGANFLGFLLGVIALEGAFKQATLISLLIPVLALGVPIFDNLFVVARRLLSGKSIYEADAGQIHHRLLKTGLHPKQIVTFISLVSICLNLMSIIILLVQV